MHNESTLPNGAVLPLGEAFRQCTVDTEQKRSDSHTPRAKRPLTKSRPPTIHLARKKQKGQGFTNTNVTSSRIRVLAGSVYLDRRNKLC